MNFSQKLELLIENFNSNNSKLAKALNIDPSLVSKWRNGHRILLPNSPYIVQIADYFLSISALSFQNDNLLSLLRPINPNIINGNRTELRKTLIEWLAMPEQSNSLKEPSSYKNSVISAESILNVFSNIQNISANIINSENIAIKLPDIIINPESGEVGNYEIYFGREGKRKAVMKFFGIVLAEENPLELLLSSQEGIEWLIEDKEFLANWAKILKQILDRKNKIKIIHKVNRNPADIVSVMHQWMPLHLTGGVESYFYPKYEDSNIKLTMFVIKDLVAVISVNPDDKADIDYTFLFTNPISVKLIESNFLAFLSNCRQLAKTYINNKMKELFYDILETERKPGYCYTLKEGLSSLTIPYAVYKNLLNNTSLTDIEKEEYLIIHKRRIDKFDETIQYYSYKEIIPIESIDKMINEENYYYPGVEFFYKSSVPAAPKDLIEHLKNIIVFLKKYKNFEVILISNQEKVNPNKMYLTLKEDYSTFFSTCDSVGSNPISVSTAEGNILQAFEDYFNDVMEKTPQLNRSKEWVIKKLEERIRRLENINKDVC